MYPANATEEAIKERIAREGRISFRDFMEMALYTAPGAYYSSPGQKIGGRGDFYTSPELHPCFGALLARQVEEVWIALGRPGHFSVVEMGPGTGVLAHDILRYSLEYAPAFHSALEYVLIERSPDLARRQLNTLAEAGVSPPPRHVGSLEQLPERSVVGCFVSNELIDSFPVYRVKAENGRLQEIFVGAGKRGLEDISGGPSSEALSEYFRRLGILPPDGCEAEVNLEALDWMHRVARKLDRGAVVTLDYGYPADELYSIRRCRGTLLCFHRHTVGSDPYERVGRQDMTSHIDFTSLAVAGEEEGLETAGLTDQASFLTSLGMGQYLAKLGRMGLGFREREANLMALRELVNPAGLGRVGVLLQHRAMDGFVPAGLHGAPRAPFIARNVDAEPPPLRTRHHIDLTAPPDVGALFDSEGMWQEMLGEDDE